MPALWPQAFPTRASFATSINDTTQRRDGDRSLTDFDQISVRIEHVAAHLGFADFRLGDETRSARTPQHRLMSTTRRLRNELNVLRSFDPLEWRMGSVLTSSDSVDARR